jgi:hypothetical protein
LKTKDSKAIKTQKNQKIQNSENTNKTGKVKVIPNFFFFDFSFSLAKSPRRRPFFFLP